MAPQVNGDSPSTSSAFIKHLTSFPVVADTVDTFKTNPYGAKSIDLTYSLYEKFGKPVVPYLAKPYQYASPYVAKADSLGDSGLSTLESKFPLVKKPTGELYSNGKSLVFFPLNKAYEGKDYVLGIYNGELKKVGGDGLVTHGKAATTTSIIVTTHTFIWLKSFVSKKAVETKETTNEKLSN